MKKKVSCINISALSIKRGYQRIMLQFSKRKTYSQVHSEALLKIAMGITPEIDQNTHKQLVELMLKENLTKEDKDYHKCYLHKYAEYCLAHRQAADPNFQSPENGETPLIKAAEQGDLKLVQLLIKYNARVNDSDNNGNTALHAASFFGNVAIVDLLLSSDANVLVANRLQQLPIHHAVDYPEIVLTLLRNESPVNALCSAKKSPLHYAVERNAPIKTFEILISKGANFTHQDSDYNTPRQVGKNSIYLQNIGYDIQLQNLEVVVTAKAIAFSNDAKWQFLLKLFNEEHVNLPLEMYHLILQNINYKDFLSIALRSDECQQQIAHFSPKVKT